MLFVHQDCGPHCFWMKNTLIPLDIVWLGTGGRVVELAQGVPGSLRPLGGNVASQYTLELPAGQARKYRLQVGSVIQF